MTVLNVAVWGPGEDHDVRTSRGAVTAVFDPEYGERLCRWLAQGIPALSGANFSADLFSPLAPFAVPDLRQVVIVVSPDQTEVHFDLVEGVSRGGAGSTAAWIVEQFNLALLDLQVHLKMASRPPLLPGVMSERAGAEAIAVADLRTDILVCDLREGEAARPGWVFPRDLPPPSGEYDVWALLRGGPSEDVFESFFGRYLRLTPQQRANASAGIRSLIDSYFDRLGGCRSDGAAMEIGAVLLGGRAAWEAAIADPGAPAPDWADPWNGEMLLDLVEWG